MLKETVLVFVSTVLKSSFLFTEFVKDFFKFIASPRRQGLPQCTDVVLPKWKQFEEVVFSRNVRPLAIII